MGFTERYRQGTTAAVVAMGVVLSLFAAPANAASDVYPTGGGAFVTDLEGWQVTEEECNLPLICEASGEHDATAGNPPGSAVASTKVILGLVNLIGSTVEFESPAFTIAGDGAATLHLDRQFVPVQLAVPEASYAVTLKDTSAATEETVLSESLEAASPTFVEREAAVDVIPGDTYVIAIAVETKATVEVGLLGNANVRFDNVGLEVESPTGDEGGGNDGGGGGGNGDASGGLRASSGLSSGELLTLVRRVAPESASVSGRRVFVKVACPRRAQQACRISVQGRIRKRQPVTRRRSVRVARGRTRLVALSIRPRFLETVAKRRRLLIVQKVRVGTATTTFARSRALIRRR